MISKRLKHIKRIAPIYYEWFKENPFIGYFNIFVVSVGYAALNSFLTKLAVNQTSDIKLFIASVFYFGLVSLYIKVNAFGGKFGLWFSIIGASLGFVYGANYIT